MKWVRFAAEGSSPTYGLVEGDTVLAVEGSPFHGYRATAVRRNLSDVRVLVPVEPRNFYAIGVNYAEHINWANRRFNMQIKPPSQFDVGYRSPNALIATDENIVVPADSIGPVQYEGELVAVVGRHAKGLSREEALDCILGYTLGNDLSDRNWQFNDRTMWRGKNADTFKPMGPFIADGVDPHNALVAVRVNGREVARYNTDKALFDLAHCIERMSRYLTLHPGDVIWMGSDGACEPDLATGDVIEIENAQVGVLRNRVTRGPA